MKNVSYAIIVGLFRLISLFPMRLLQQFGKVIGALAWQFNTQARRVTEENLAICFPDMEAGERTALTKSSLQQLGMMAMELGYVWCRPSEQILSRITAVHGRSHIDAAIAEGKGIVVLAPHIGSWELLGVYLAQHFTLTNMYQPPDNPALDAMIYNARQRNGSGLVPTNVTGVKALLKALKRGELVGVLPDQVPPLESGEFAPFFGIPALTATMPFNLLRRTGAKAVVAYAIRVPDSADFHIIIEPVSEALYCDDSATSLAALNQSIERCVLAAPEQYQWEYKRFKKQPGNEKKYYQNR